VTTGTLGAVVEGIGVVVGVIDVVVATSVVPTSEVGGTVVVLVAGSPGSVVSAMTTGLTGGGLLTVAALATTTAPSPSSIAMTNTTTCRNDARVGRLTTPASCTCLTAR